ncbi:MAG: MBL fold metallo-hydrolase [Desulfobacteraceae bacterium]|jgi:L-ascorbate metabolism protein UlaG (beta-lactamase superfamily)
MKIKWNGHASYTITSADGTVLVTDPYDPNGYEGAMQYAEVTDRADAAVVSHDHADHNYVAGLTGNPQIMKGSGNIKDIEIKGIETFHDESGGSERGKNVVFIINIDDMRVCFCGDLGHQLSDKQINIAGKIDILLVPVGGFFTLDAEGAAQLVGTLKPKIVIPMHYKTSKCGFPISDVEPFLALMKDVKKPNTVEIEIYADQLPETGPETWVLNHAC